MKIRIHRLCVLMLISLWLVAFATLAAAQSQILNQSGHSPKLRANTGKRHQASTTETASGYDYEVLYSFGSNATDGLDPWAGLIQDADGNLYGTTTGGGANYDGMVFKLAPPAQQGGTWTETVPYSFCAAAGCADGAIPFAGLIQDAAGNLYGTAAIEGAGSYFNYAGGYYGGTVFKLAPPALEGGNWTDTVLYSFCSATNCTDGEYPWAGLIQDAAGNLYGTTAWGGNRLDGTVFKLAPPALEGGSWTETVLYSFCSEANCADGQEPEAGLIEDAAGNLYGTTNEGGAGPYINFAEDFYGGTVFKLAPSAQPDGSWTETVLYSFCSVANCTDGNYPWAGLIEDAAGNLYGTTSLGGANTSGTVFKLQPPAQGGGSWTKTVLYNFCSEGGANCTDGAVPEGGLIKDAAGNLYGTTFKYGANNAGVVFKLAPPAQPGGNWTETVLYSFCSAAGCTDGAKPQARLIQDAAGNLYGTTTTGGVNDFGTVFELALPFSVSGTAVSITPGATTGNTSTITVTPSGGFTGSVTLTAVITGPAGAQDPPTVSFGTTSPVSITGANAGTATLTITTTAPTSAVLAHPERHGFRWNAGGTTLAFGLLFGMGIGIPGRRRSWRTRLGAPVLLVVLIAGLLACGSGSGGGGGGGNSGTTPGTYTVTVTGTSGSTTAVGTFKLTVQ